MARRFLLKPKVKKMAERKQGAGSGGNPVEKLDPGNPEDVAKWLAATKNDPKPNEITENDSIFLKNMEHSSPEGEGQDRASPPRQLKPDNKNIDISPEDPAYAAGLEDVRRAIAALPDSTHKDELNGLFNAIAHLPSREVERLQKMAGKKAEKWVGIPKVPPAIYKKRPADQPLPEFLAQHYRPLVEAGIPIEQSHIDALDPTCGAAIRYWVLQYGDVPPEAGIRVSKRNMQPKQSVK